MQTPGRILAPAFAAMALGSCDLGDFDLAGWACEEGECLSGFACHPEENVCVPAITVSCDGSGICPSEVVTGTDCRSPGSFIPCVNDEQDCTSGCRTCSRELTWSECSAASCEDLDGDALPDCDDGCVDFDHDGIGDGTNGNSSCLHAASDRASSDPTQCADTDADSCDDCAGGVFAPQGDGPDLDADGVCDAGDPDADGDAATDSLDAAPRDPLLCSDQDQDGCDDCSAGQFSTSNDGADLDADGACDLTDPDRDGDTVPNGLDPAPSDAHLCQDADSDGCDDCAVLGGPPRPDNDGPDADADGICDG